MATIEHTPATNRQHGEAARLRREDGLTNPQIALRIGVDRSTIDVWLGVTPRGLCNSHPQEMKDRARALREVEGLTNFQIGKRLGVHQDTVGRWLGRTPRELRRDRDYSWTNLPERARHLRYCGYSIREAAKHMSVPPSTVGQWVKGYGRYGLLD
jgi:transposase